MLVNPRYDLILNPGDAPFRDPNGSRKDALTHATPSRRSAERDAILDLRPRKQSLGGTAWLLVGACQQDEIFLAAWIAVQAVIFFGHPVFSAIAVRVGRSDDASMFLISREHVKDVTRRLVAQRSRAFVS
jgi:hypothetical protein